MPTDSPCPCQSKKPFQICCKPLLSKETLPKTAKALMRSRYTAYTIGNTEYLLRTWHPSTRPEQIDTGLIPEWCGLTIKNCKDGGPADSKGTVEFIAIAHNQTDVITLHEVSNFLKENEQWFYVDGEIIEPNIPIKKVGRNDPCSCGSGKKFKRCCNR